MKKTNEKSFHWWALGVSLLGFFFLNLIEPPPDHVTFQCDRAKHMCTVEKRGFFRNEITNIQIEDIRYAHFEKVGFLMRGYHGPELKLLNGNDISIGAGSTPFTSKEQKTVEEINSFLSNAKLEHLSITQKSIPTIFIAGIFLVGGLFSLYKAVKPYITQGLANR